jgi:hypothetical protein
MADEMELSDFYPGTRTQKWLRQPPKFVTDPYLNYHIVVESTLESSTLSRNTKPQRSTVD